MDIHTHYDAQLTWDPFATPSSSLGVTTVVRPARKAHPALLVRNLRGLVLRLREAGVDVVDDEPLPGFDRVFTADPFGNRLELLEPLR